MMDGPADSSAWSRPDRAFDDRPQPPPVQRSRPPAALPPGPSASATDTPGDSTPSEQDLPAVAASAQTQATDAVAEVAEVAKVVEIQPSAGAASPTGTVKPPPVTEVPQSAPLVPLPPERPSPSAPPGPPVFGVADGGDVGPDDDTAPLPVILPDRMPDELAPSARMRDPFEPIERQPAPLPRRVIRPNAAEATTSVQATDQGAAKLDQIKDLYLTAEAIGEDALGQHFEQVSDRQRQLIREYFDQMAARGAEGQPEN